MKLGYLSVNAASGMLPAALGRELEARGFESIWVPEHSHIPVASVDQYPGGVPLPDGYAHAMNPFLSLMSAAAATSTLTLGTGICLPLEHDLMDLACTTGTLDTLSDSRFIMGVGVGWNSDELRNHRPQLPFKKRYSALRDRIAALRAAWCREPTDTREHHFSAHAWGDQIAQYEGEFDAFSPSWVFPKPKRGYIPVAVGMAGPLGLQHAAQYADIWLPVDIALMHEGKSDVVGRISAFREELARCGRAPESVPITLFVWGEENDRMFDQYVELGIERLVLSPPSFAMHSQSDTLKRLDDLQGFVDRYRP